MTVRNDLGKILKQQRVRIPMTLSELSVAAGISSSHLGRIERGERFPSARVLRRIAKPLGFGESELFSQAGFLSPLLVSESQGEHNVGRLNPYVAAVLSQEPVEIQRAVVAILSILKSMAKAEGLHNVEFAEYVHRKYPGPDEDTITMIEDIMEHPPKGKRSSAVLTERASYLKEVSGD